ncbi:nucleic acid-binding protein [Exidia glandulosa HHB12029]|uniref:Nucleic acid-binding protein n=1 Tax=Exidia glandulosa HHB12029 TaxID=1314781 RepID=A0A166BQ86_EXIGL|nr:nucleic acid-binding protein [Exidia glandulosa HHB12029]
MPPMQLIGRVSKAGKMVKTVTVTVDRLVVQKPTLKRIKRTKNYLVHDEADGLRVDDVVLIRNCPPISKLKRFTFEKLLKSPEGELEARRAAAAMQATLDDNGLQPPVLPDWTPVAPRAAATPKYTLAEIEAMPFRTRRLLEVQGKIRLDAAPASS